MEDRFKFRIPMFTDKDHFSEFQYIELGDTIECTLCGYNKEPQQCTGLKDKNGKLLYWYDIVKDDFGRLFIIEPCKGTFHMQSIKLFKDGGYHKDSCYNYTMYSENSYEIIGNIYENPELLAK